jgi:TorA maturation chaperone TorD
VALALGRAGLYRLLGGALGYPGPERLEEVGRAARAAAAAAGTPVDLRQALERLATAAGTADPAGLAEEYTFLFDRGVRCPPYESAWGEAAQLAGKAAALADIGGFYAAFGLAPAHAQPELEDHVAAECEFMSALGLKEAWALAQGHAEGLAVTRDAQAAFLRDHLGRWAGAFARALGEAAALPYYGAVAETLEVWVETDATALGAIPVRVEGRRGWDPVQEEEAMSCPLAAEAADEPAGSRNP